MSNPAPRPGPGPFARLFAWLGGRRGDLVAQPIPETPFPALPRLVSQLGHASAVEGVAFSDDETLLVTVASRGPAILWEAGTGRELRRLAASGGGVSAAAFTRNGAQVVTGGRDGSLAVWDVATGARRRTLLAPGADEGSAVIGLLISADGDSIFARRSAGDSLLLDARSGVVRARSLLASGTKGHAAFDESGRLLAFGVRAARYAAVERVDDGRELWRRECKEHARGCFTPDGAALLFFDGDGSGRSLSRLEGATGAEAWTRPLPGEAYLEWPPAVSSRANELFLVRRGERIDLGNGTVKESRIDRVAISMRLDEANTRFWTRSLDGEAAEPEPPTLDFEGASAAYTPSGREVVILKEIDRSVHRVDLDAREERQRYAGQGDTVTSVALSADGTKLLVASGFPGGTVDDSDDHVASTRAMTWNVSSGARTHACELHPTLSWAAFTADGERVIHASAGGPEVRDVYSGERLFALEPGPAHRVAIAPKDELLLLGGEDGLLAYELATDGARADLDGPRAVWNGEVADLAFWPDGGRFAICGPDAPVRVVRLGEVWEVEHELDLEDAQRVACAPLHPGARRLAAASGARVRLWTLDGPPQLGPELDAGPGEVSALAFTPDGRGLITGTSRGSLRRWDLTTGDDPEFVELDGHEGAVECIAFSHDGRRLLTGGADQTTRIRDLGTNVELGRLFSFRGGTWAVVDAHGRFDASNGGDLEGLHWVVGCETFALAQLKARYYQPGLLAQLVTGAAEDLREVGSIYARGLALPPRVETIREPSRDDATFSFRVIDAGGGIGRVSVLVNGKEVVADARGPLEPSAGVLEISLALDEYPAFVPGIGNRIEVVPYNAEQYLSARGLSFEAAADDPEDGELPALWAVVAGVSRYAGPSLRLRYAASDARSVAGALRAAGEDLFGAENVHVTALEDEAATRAGVLAALDALKDARWCDVVVVYLAGHGVSWDGPTDDSDGYHFLTQDAVDADLADPVVRARTTLSSHDLHQRLSQLACRKQAVVLDTCAAGQLLGDLTAGRNVSTSQRRALERLKDRTGTFLLAGSTADAVSYEATPYGHGLLTFSLLQALRQGVRPAVDRDGLVRVLELFVVAQERVPVLARGLGGIQEPQLAMPDRGASFAIGKLDSARRASVPLRSPLPVLLLSSFQLEEEPLDELDLAGPVATELRARSEGGRSAGFLFLDGAPSPDAYRLGGRYRVEDGSVTVDARLYHGHERKEQFEVVGKTADLKALAVAIVDRVRDAFERDHASPGTTQKSAVPHTPAPVSGATHPASKDETGGSKPVIDDDSAPGRALVVGVGKYTSHDVTPLRGAANDAKRMHAFLRDRRGFEADKMTLLLDREATRERFLEELEGHIASLREDELFVLYLSTHGSQSPDLGDDEEDDWDETFILYDSRSPGGYDLSDDNLRYALNQLSKRQAVVILDTCHSGSGTRGVLQAKAAAPRPPGTSFSPPPEIDREGRGKVHLHAVDVEHVLLTAAASNQVAVEAEIEGCHQGVFTAALLAALENGGDEKSLVDLVQRDLRQEVKKLRRKLKVESLANPQMEAPSDAWDVPLFALEREHPRLPSRSVEVAAGKRARLVDGGGSRAQIGSVWDVHPREEKDFPPGRALARGRCAEITADGAALLEFARGVPAMPDRASGVRAVRVAGPPAGPIGLHLADAGVRAALAERLRAGLGAAGRITERFEPGCWTVSAGPDGGFEAVLADEKPWASLSAATAVPDLLALMRHDALVAAFDAVEHGASRLGLRFDIAESEEPPGVKSRGARIAPEVGLPTYDLSKGEALRKMLKKSKAAPKGSRDRKKGRAEAERLRTPENSLRLCVDVERPCWLLIVAVDSAGASALIFPNRKVPDGSLKRGRTRIPDDGARFRLDIVPPAGIQALAALVVDDAEAAKTIQARITRNANDPDAQIAELRSLREDLLFGSLAHVDWDAASVTYVVREGS